jgi:hypothetical protein
MRSRVRRISFAWMAMSVAGPAGAAARLVDHEARVRQAHAPLLGRGEEHVRAGARHPPVPTVVTGARTKRMTSWIASPDSTWPPATRSAR